MTEAIETIERDGYTLSIYPCEHSDNPRTWDNLGVLCLSDGLGDRKIRGSEGLLSELVDELGIGMTYRTCGGYQYHCKGFDLSSLPEPSRYLRKAFGEYWNENSAGLLFPWENDGKNLWTYIFNEWEGVLDAHGDLHFRYQALMNEILDALAEVFCVLPVYKYEHSGVAYNTSGFSCPWDSGMVGYIFTPWENNEGLDRDKIEANLRGEVETFNQWANGEVYSYSIDKFWREGNVKCEEHIDSCCGFFGREYALEEGKSALDFAIEQEKESTNVAS